MGLLPQRPPDRHQKQRQGQHLNKNAEVPSQRLQLCVYETAKSKKRPAVLGPLKGCGTTLQLHPNTRKIWKYTPWRKDYIRAAKSKEFRKEYATTNNLKIGLTLEKIEKNCQGQREHQREHGWNHHGQRGTTLTTNKLSNYHRGKSSELQMSKHHPKEKPSHKKSRSTIRITRK